MTKINRREFLKITLITASAAVLATSGYGFMIEPSWIEITHTSVPIPGLKPPLEGFRLVVIGDIHVGTWISQSQLQNVVDLVNQLDADLIVHTGDFVGMRKTIPYIMAKVTRDESLGFGHSPEAEDLFSACIPLVAKMKSKHGAIAVLGNHEYWVDPAAARKYLRDYGISLLENKSKLVTVDGASLNFAGVGDLWEGTQDLTSAFAGTPSPYEAPRIVISHNPDFADDPQVARSGAVLMLSGHTHGGQVTFPGIGSPLLPIHNKRYASGLVDTEWGYVYISKGIGCTQPAIRIGTRPEIAVLELTAA